MFHRKSIISACLALIVPLLSAAVLAANDNAASPQSSATTTTTTTTDANTGSVDETKLRIGPGDPVAGKNKAVTCFGCHGEDGNSAVSQFPKLAGQYGIYIAKQMRDYQAGLLNHQLMSTIAASVSDADLSDIAAYFASQPMMKGDQPSSNMIGKSLFEKNDLSRMMVRCNSCHGVTGKGQNAGNPVYPVIGGQHKDYLLKQLLNYRNGVRNNSTGGLMNIIVHKLSDAELDAVADYVSGL